MIVDVTIMPIDFTESIEYMNGIMFSKNVYNVK